MRCPICKRAVEEPADANPSAHFPFCGERCKLIDLGRWLDGKYQIPVEPEDADSESAQDLPPTFDS